MTMRLHILAIHTFLFPSFEMPCYAGGDRCAESSVQMINEIRLTPPPSQESNPCTLAHHPAKSARVSLASHMLQE